MLFVTRFRRPTFKKGSRKRFCGQKIFWEEEKPTEKLCGFAKGKPQTKGRALTSGGVSLVICVLKVEKFCCLRVSRSE